MKNKKINIILSIIVIIIVGVIIFLFLNNNKVNSSNDYSKMPIVNTTWTRTKNDTEYLTFYDNGRFSYYCLCGNPVDDSDMYSTYTYDSDSKTIWLHCDFDENVKMSIKIISYDEDNLKLDFDGEIRDFVRKIEDEPDVLN